MELELHRDVSPLKSAMVHSVVLQVQIGRETLKISKENHTSLPCLLYLAAFRRWCFFNDIQDGWRVDVSCLVAFATSPSGTMICLG